MNSPQINVVCSFFLLQIFSSSIETVLQTFIPLQDVEAAQEIAHPDAQEPVHHSSTSESSASLACESSCPNPAAQGKSASLHPSTTFVASVSYSSYPSSSLFVCLLFSLRFHLRHSRPTIFYQLRRSLNRHSRRFWKQSCRRDHRDIALFELFVGGGSMCMRHRSHGRGRGELQRGKVTS